MLQENGRLCIALACLDNVALFTSVLGSVNDKFLAKVSNAPASNGLKKNREKERRAERTEQKEKRDK